MYESIEGICMAHICFFISFSTQKTLDLTSKGRFDHRLCIDPRSLIIQPNNVYFLYIFSIYDRGGFQDRAGIQRTLKASLHQALAVWPPGSHRTDALLQTRVDKDKPASPQRPIHLCAF